MATEWKNLPNTSTPITAENLIKDQTAVQNTEPTGGQGVWIKDSKNLLPINATSQTISGVTITINSDKTITVNGTSTNQIELLIGKRTLKSGSYKANIGVSGTTSTYYLRLGEGETSSSSFIANVGTGDSAFTLNADKTVGALLIIKNGITVSNITIKPMIRLADISDATYEPYIDNPPILVLNGNQYKEIYNKDNMGDLVVDSITGKNLFDKNNAYIVNGAFNAGTVNTLTNDTASTTIYIPCKPNTTYTISKTLGARFFVGYTTTTPASGVEVFGRLGANNSTEWTITTGSNAKYLVAYIYNSTVDSSLTLAQVLATVQIENGSSATEYDEFMKYGYNSEESMGNIVVDGIEGKNLYNATKASYATNAVTYGADTNKLYMNGTPSADVRIQFGKSIYLKRGTYTFSMTLSSGTINRNTTFYLYSGTNSTEISWNVVSSLTVTPTINNVATVTFNVANGGYIFLANYLYTNQTFTNAEFNYIIEKGDKFTGFISYDTYANSEREEYSTGEEKIGRWIDGKILYRKTINTGALPNNTTKTIAHNISNIDFIVHTYGSASNGTNFFPLPLPYNTLADTIICFANKTNILIATGTDRSSYTTSYVTLEYTKTTDA